MKTKKIKQMEHFFSSNIEHFPPQIYTLRCTPIQIIGGDADVNHSQTIVGDTAKLFWGYIPPPPFVSAPLVGRL